jgi:dihydroorotate dehydrogenase (NAD+) catalytic subunit
MVYQIRQAVRLPILGVGGISSAEDALEFLAAGADAIQVGTMNFVDPGGMIRLIADMERLLEAAGTTVTELIAAAHRPAAEPLSAVPGEVEGR